MPDGLIYTQIMRESWNVLFALCIYQIQARFMTDINDKDLTCGLYQDLDICKKHC